MSPLFTIQNDGITLKISAEGPRAPHQETAREREHRERLEAIAAMGKCLVVPFALTKESVRLFLTVFRCRHCGRCCTRGAETPHDVGIVVLPREQKRIAHLLGLNAQALMRRYGSDGSVHLAYPCPFYDAGRRRCAVYEQRPLVCRSFPIEGGEYDYSKETHLGSFCPGAREVAVQFALVLDDLRERLGQMMTAGVSDWEDDQ